MYTLSFFIGIVAYLLAEVTGSYSVVNYIDQMDRLEEFLFGYIILFSYYTVFEAITKRSLGKYVTGTVVVMENGEKPEFADIILRSLCRMIPFDAFSYLGETGRGWHDSLSKTYVVEIKKLDERKRLALNLNELGTGQDAP